MDRKLNDDFRNVLKNVIWSLQVGFTDDFVSDFPLNRPFYS